VRSAVALAALAMRRMTSVAAGEQEHGEGEINQCYRLEAALP